MRFFKNEKITEENLRALKSRITNLLAGAKPSENKSQTSKKIIGLRIYYCCSIIANTTWNSS